MRNTVEFTVSFFVDSPTGEYSTATLHDAISDGLERAFRDGKFCADATNEYVTGYNIARKDEPALPPATEGEVTNGR